MPRQISPDVCGIGLTKLTCRLTYERSKWFARNIIPTFAQRNRGQKQWRNIFDREQEWAPFLKLLIITRNSETATLLNDWNTPAMYRKSEWDSLSCLITLSSYECFGKARCFSEVHNSSRQMESYSKKGAPSATSAIVYPNSMKKKSSFIAYLFIISFLFPDKNTSWEQHGMA